MKRDAVYVREVEIHRALGVRRGEGFGLTDLAPGVNILFGPNGSGKSTTCRVIQELLWPGLLERPSANGVVADNGDEWRIELDAGHAQVYRNGHSSPTPDFGSRENRSRYLLGLSDLIVDDSSDFAKAVADASQGGYDLARASDDLGFRARPKMRKAECDRVHERSVKVDVARRAQLHVEREGERLDELNRQHEAAIEAGRELERLVKAREYLDAQRRCSELKLEISTFPDGVRRLQGDERKQLDALQDEENLLLEQNKAEEERRRRAQQDLEALQVPEDGVSDECLRELKTLRRSLRDVEARLEEERRRYDAADAKAGEALRGLGNRFSEEQLARIESLEMPDLGGFTRRFHRIRGTEAMHRERRSWLQQEEPEETRTVSEDELHEGIGVLTRWLASPPPPGVRPSRSWPSASAFVLLIAAAVGIGSIAGGLWALVVLVAAVLVGLDWWMNRRASKARSDTSRNVHRVSYSSLSLPNPERWDEENVVSHLRTLVRLHGTKVLFTEREARLNQLKSEEEELKNARLQLERQRTELEAELGFSLEVDDEWLPVLVENVHKWQVEKGDAAAAAAAVARHQELRAELVQQIGGLLSTYGYETVESWDAADEIIADLERLRNQHESARATLERASDRIDGSILPGLANVASRRAAIFERLEIAEDEEFVLDEWITKYDALKALQDAFAKQEAVCGDRAAALSAHSDLLHLDAAEIGARIQANRSASEARDELKETIGNIKGQIKEKKAGHELSDALKERDEALVDLAAAREENGRAVTGALLADWVRREAVERSRPQVFRRANELFVRFTHGNLHLEMDDGSVPPVFVARRGSHPCQSLGELSDGERIQLMAAVRLAFLEHDESRRLPLLVDEVLGTSDDARSGVLIDTLIDVARQGRQVFYCTAQHDEVGKWKARLHESGVPFEVVDLGELRGGLTRRVDPLEIAHFETADPPPPGALSYEEYGDALEVSALDPHSDSISDVHLWHVLDDTHLLYSLLSKGVTTWGQLQTLYDHGGAGVIDIDEQSMRRARAAAKALRCACDAWRIGRGMPIDRSVLLDSDCVSDRFIDELAGLARSVDGDAAAVIDALENRAVSNWRSDNTERLREYLEEEGYLRVEATLSRQDLRVHVLAATAPELNAGILDVPLIDRIIAALCTARSKLRLQPISLMAGAIHDRPARRTAS